jgi:hypothetical protein
VRGAHGEAVSDGPLQRISMGRYGGREISNHSPPIWTAAWHQRQDRSPLPRPSAAPATATSPLHTHHTPPADPHTPARPAPSGRLRASYRTPHGRMNAFKGNAASQHGERCLVWHWRIRDGLGQRSSCDDRVGQGTRWPSRWQWPGFRFSRAASGPDHRAAVVDCVCVENLHGCGVS